MDYNLVVKAPSPDNDDLTIGQSTIDRTIVASNACMTADQQVRLSYFTSNKSEIVSQIRIISGSTAAAATPTLVKIGLYMEEADLSLTRIAVTANDLTLFAAANTSYTRSFLAPVQLERGRRYAVGVLVLSAVAVPSLQGQSALLSSENSIAPRVTGAATGMSDHPTSIAAANLGISSSRFYAAILP